MSASDKKKLRKEQEASKMTARQTREQKEAKKLKRYTVGFVTVMAIVLCVAIGVVAVRGVIQSGYFQKRSIAAQIGDNQLTAVELSYYYVDVINEQYNDWYSKYGANTELYLELLMDLKLSEPLDKQFYDEKTGQTWSEYFIEAAIKKAKHNYILGELAEKEDFELPVEKKESIDSELFNLKFWSQYYGYSSISKYLGATYCYGASEASYRRYREMCELADAFYEHYAASLKYDDAAIRDYEKDKYINYTMYNYSTVYLSYTYFLGEGTKDANGNVTYTDAERDEAREKAKAAAELLLTAKTFEDLEKAVKAMDINKDKTVVSAANSKNTLYPSIPAIMQAWVSDASRVQGDNTVIANEVKSETDEDEDEEGNEGTESSMPSTQEEEKSIINGYYVVLFDSSNENKVPMSDVRHLLVAFEGGKENEETGETEYTEEEKNAAKEQAEKLLKEWKEATDGATEETFIELVKKNTDDESSAESGGLFEDIVYSSNYVQPFLDWALDPARTKGETGIIETEYGYHIMYFVEWNELNFRDFLISADMRAEEMEKWYEDTMKTMDGTAKDLYWIETDMKIAG